MSGSGPRSSRLDRSPVSIRFKSSPEHRFLTPGDLGKAPADGRFRSHHYCRSCGAELISIGWVWVPWIGWGLAGAGFGPGWKVWGLERLKDVLDEGRRGGPGILSPAQALVSQASGDRPGRHRRRAA